MSNDDYMVDPLSNSDVREHARRLRRFLKLADAERIDPLALEKVSEIWTVAGVKPFRFEAVADDDLPNDSGLTTYDGSALSSKFRGVFGTMPSWVTGTPDTPSPMNSDTPPCIWIS